MKGASEPLLVSRDCEAVEIPAGTPIIITQGTQVVLMQSLGGSYPCEQAWRRVCLDGTYDGKRWSCCLACADGHEDHS